MLGQPAAPHRCSGTGATVKTGTDCGVAALAYSVTALGPACGWAIGRGQGWRRQQPTRTRGEEGADDK